ncbi:MAG: polysaccharide biosynthesis/export family protein [Acidobacteria bacterium]|nr:polysaccharide biosynthesis/export family protein [Acidobacteriota bacterium]
MERLVVQTTRILFLILVLAAGVGNAQQQPFATPEETNERIRQLASVFQAKAGNYLIGSGDLLRIDVFDVPELSREVRVSESGHISLPLIPVKVRAGGLTAFQLEEKLAELLQVNGLVSHPQVTIFVKEHRSQPITVIGAVNRPTTLQAIRHTTLLEALSEAGGLADEAGSVVIVTRPANLNTPSEASSAKNENGSPTGAQTITIGLKQLLASGDPQYNIPIFGGDVISVPRAGIVYVVGAVQRSGGFALKSDSEEMTALKAVALAQGLKGTAKPGQAAIIRKDPDTGRELEIDVNLKKIMARKARDVRLYPNDILFVPDSMGKKVLRRAGEAAIAITTGVIIWRR